MGGIKTGHSDSRNCGNSHARQGSRFYRICYAGQMDLHEDQECRQKR